jgi:hypothetical protein
MNRAEEFQQRRERYLVKQTGLSIEQVGAVLNADQITAWQLGEERCAGARRENLAEYLGKR